VTTTVQQQLTRVLLAQDTLQRRIETLAETVRQTYAPSLAIIVLNGAALFGDAMLRRLPGVKSARLYAPRGTVPRLPAVTGERVLLIDDTVETGKTIVRLRDLLLAAGAAEVQLCTLLDKPTGREVAVEPEFVGFTVPEIRTFGYGMDHEGLFRELPFIATFDDELENPL